MRFRIAVLPGDGIGPEVVAQGVKALQAVGVRFGHNFELDYRLVGAAASDEFGVPLPPESVLACQQADSVLFGAVGDPRFMPLVKPELADVEFEISVLSEFERIEDPQQIEVGKHGLLISKKNSRGLLLPQIATAYGWSRERFLAETCMKAGLLPGEWKDGATIHCFSAQVFSERQHRLTAVS